MCEVLDRIENRGIQQGIIQGEDTILSLMHYLLDNGRLEDARRATVDEVFRKELLEELAGNNL